MGNTPNIRFKGFTDDWEQRKLGEICQRVIRKNKNNESDLPLTIASQYGLIDQRDFFNKVVAAKDMSNYYLLRKGEFAYNKSYSNGFEYGSIKRLNAYEQGCLSTLYICFEITSDEVDSDYLECFFDTLKWYGDLSMICAEGARNHGLLNVDIKAFFADINVSTPTNLKEQRKIATYLNNLDHLITLHQRKLFLNFAKRNDWEQRKLGDTVQITMGQSPDGSTYSETPSDYILVQGNADLKDGWVSPRVWTSQMTKKADAGDLIMSVRAPAGAMGKTAYNAVIGRGVAAIKGNEFIYQSLVKMDSNGYWKKLSNGSTFESLNSNNIKDAEIFVPCDEEQQKIGQYFSNLDNLITLHQRKLFLNFAKRNDWEQRKLGEILIGLQNNTLSRADLSNETGVAKNVHYGDVLIKFGEVLDVSKEKLPMISDESILSKYKSSFLQNGDVIVADTAEDSTVGKCSEIAGLNDEIVLSGLHTIPYRPIEKFASGYLGYYLNSSAYHNQLIPLMQGIKVTAISKSAMQDTDIVYPKSMEEQGKIGDYFQLLDNLITLHRRAYYNKKGGLTNVHNDNQQHYAIL